MNNSFHITKLYLRVSTMCSVLFLPLYTHLFLMTCLLSECYWSRFGIWRNWDPKKQTTWPRAQGSRDGVRMWGQTATPQRYLLHILFGPFINIIVREHVCFIVTCSILVHPVFLEKWISFSLFIQDNKTKQKAREQYWSNGGHPDCKRKCPWVSILSERHPFIKQTRNIPTGFK